MTTTKRTTAKPPSWWGSWPVPAGQPQPTVEYGPAREDYAGEKRFFDVYVNGEYAGWVYRYNYTAEHPTHRGSRIVVRGKADAAVEWLHGTGPSTKAPSGFGLGAQTKAEAALRVVGAFTEAKR